MTKMPVIIMVTGFFMGIPTNYYKSASFKTPQNTKPYNIIYHPLYNTRDTTNPVKKTC